jgi:hypothetical protein
LAWELLRGCICARPSGESKAVPDGGIAPDIPVTATREDIARGEDPELRAVLAAIAGR